MFETDKEICRQIIDERIYYLICDFYRGGVTIDIKQKLMHRIAECVYLAENLGIISMEDWHVLNAIVFFMGTDYDMEERCE